MDNRSPTEILIIADLSLTLPPFDPSSEFRPYSETQLLTTHHKRKEEKKKREKRGELCEIVRQG